MTDRDLSNLPDEMLPVLCKDSDWSWAHGRHQSGHIYAATGERLLFLRGGDESHELAAVINEANRLRREVARLQQENAALRVLIGRVLEIQDESGGGSWPCGLSDVYTSLDFAPWGEQSNELRDLLSDIRAAVETEAAEGGCPTPASGGGEVQ